MYSSHPFLRPAFLVDIAVYISQLVIGICAAMAYNDVSYMYNTGYGSDRPQSQQSSNSDFHRTPQPFVAPLLTSSPPPLDEVSASTKKTALPLPLQRLSIDRPYLRSPQYLDYIKRKRQDVGKDQKPVWPDHVEESFQKGAASSAQPGWNLTFFQHSYGSRQWAARKGHRMASCTGVTN